MDLMANIQDENFGENIYVCVYYDDYSIIYFIHENPHTSTAFKAIFHHLQCDKGENGGNFIRTCHTPKFAR